jgi:NAD(P)-dependent dehydrogenase (short-subunit alcohol dehydrogenase family)
MWCRRRPLLRSPSPIGAYVETDVSDQRATLRMAAFAIDKFGRIDVLVNNAGLFSSLAMKPCADIAMDEWDRVMAVNVRGTFGCVQAVLPHMRNNGYGKIVNIASGTVFKGSPMLLHYVTSKGAIIAMTRSLARELGEFGIRVNTLAPGLIMTENVAANADWNGIVANATVATRSIKREAEVKDLVGSLLYLCSEQSDFVTGQCIVVDGGSVMH